MDLIEGAQNLIQGKPSKKGEMDKAQAKELREKQNAAAAQPEVELQSIKDVCNMQGGDYMIHVHVQKAKQLNLPGEESVDPYCNVTILGRHQYTSNKTDITNHARVVYDEHLFFDLRDLGQDEIENAKIVLAVENKGFFKGDLIGQYELSVNKIYNMKDHVMMNQQIGLNNPASGDYAKITGYLAVSIQVQKVPQDESVELKLATDEQLTVKKPMIPTEIQIQYKQLYLRFYFAENLPKMDWGMFEDGSIDAYLKVTYNGVTLRTCTAKPDGKRHFKWEEVMLIPIELPLRDDRIRIQLWDEDTFVDEFVCSLTIPVKSTLKYIRTDPRKGPSRLNWINFYGPPEGNRDGAAADEMKRDEMKASAWAGRMLVEYFVMDEKYPIFKAQKMKLTSKEINDVYKKFLDKKKQYMVIGEFGTGMSLPGSKQYSMMVSIGPYHLNSPKPKEVKQNYNRWDKEFQHTFEENYPDLKDFPTLYVYLMDGDKPICYFRESVIKFAKREQGLGIEGNDDPSQGPYGWYQFEPNLPVGEVKSQMHSGIFSMRLYFHDITKNGPFDYKQIPAWRNKPPSRLDAYKMRVAIYQAEALPPADQEGTSDPYVQVFTTDESTVNTIVVNDTNNPIYYQVCEFTYDFKKVETAPPIVLSVYDKDEDIWDSTDDLIGRAIIPLEEIIKRNNVDSSVEDFIEASKNDTISKPRWYPIKKFMNQDYDRESGPAILCSFQMVELDHKFTLNADEIELDNAKLELRQGVPYPMPDLKIKEFKCDIVCLGLRDLVSPGILPINKAYVNFNLKSLMSAAKAKAVNNIKTEPTDAGANPNLRTTISFGVQMPSDSHYCPRMTCDVYDLMFLGGLGQPLIGTFTLKMGDILAEQDAAAEQTELRFKNVIQLLDQVKTLVDTKHNLGEEIDAEELVQETIQSNHGFKKYLSSRQSVLKQKRGKSIFQSQSSRLGGGRILQGLADQGIDKLPSSHAVKSWQKKQQKGEMRDPNESIQKVRNQNDPGLSMNFDSVNIQKKVKGDANLLAMRDSRNLTSRSSIDGLDHETDFEKLQKALGDNLRRKVKDAYEHQQAEVKEERDKRRSRDQQQLQKSIGSKATLNRVEAQYYFDDRLQVQRELNRPPESLFIELGHDKQPGDGTKHYRRYYPNELEEIQTESGEYLINSPFLSVDIQRAKPIKAKSFLDTLFQKDDNDEGMSVIKTGIFKGLVKVFDEAAEQTTGHAMLESATILAEKVKELFQHEGIKLDATETARRGDWTLINMLNGIKQGTKYSVGDTEDALDNFRLSMNDCGLANLGIYSLMCDVVFSQQLKKRLNDVIDCKVRVYMIEGFNFAKRDMFSDSDPYLTLQCGDDKFNESDNYQLNTSKPIFHKSYDFIVTFPGSPSLVISAWDSDTLFGDELIGTSKVDLDDRYYSLKWQSMDYSPVEYRDLFHHSSTSSQGVVKMWVEINEKEHILANKPPIDITPTPAEDIEVRLVVWKTKEIPVEKLDWEGAADIQCHAYFNSDDKKYTDTHWRSFNGNGSFNYRIKLTTNNKQPDAKLQLECMDRDILKNDDLIGGCQLNLNAMREDLMLTRKKMILHKVYWDTYLKEQLEEIDDEMANQVTFEDDPEKFWVPILYKDSETEIVENRGWMQVTVHMMLASEAEKYPQGEAREEPNNEPFCPEPEGRIKFTVNPFDLIGQIIPPDVLRKIYGYLCCGLFCFLFILMAPNIISQLIVKFIIG